MKGFKDSLKQADLYNKVRTNKNIITVVVVAVLLAAFLMLSTLSYKNDSIEVSGHMWSDFLLHIPLTRSFSEGDNFPPESPLYSGERIKYHFLFDATTGFLENAGLRIDVAMNLLSIIGLAGLLVAIYLLAHKITKSKPTAWLAMLMFFFNPSFSWIYYLTDRGLSLKSVTEVVTNNNWAAFGPYDDNLISAFWTLNVYTNQRHLALSFALMFFAVWAIFYSRKRYMMMLGVLVIGIMPWLNKAILLMLFVLLILFFLSDRAKRMRVFILTALGGVLALPGIGYLTDQSAVGERGFRFHLGFLYNATTWKELPESKLFTRWIFYWLLNLGFLPIAAIAGLLKLERIKLPKLKTRNLLGKLDKLVTTYITEKNIWFISAVIMFVIGNTFVFAIDLAVNHKFINYIMLILNIYAAYFIVWLFKERSRFLAVIALFTLTFGGILDLFPILNVEKAYWQDFEASPTASWIRDNTDANTAFMNLTYDVGSIGTAGRKVFYGWDYLSWSLGYDLIPRKKIIQKIAQGMLPKQEVCDYLAENKLSYIFMNPHTQEFVEVAVNYSYFQENFKLADAKETAFPFLIYDVEKSCN